METTKYGGLYFLAWLVTNLFFLDKLGAILRRLKMT